jgi:hypothetical protein
MDRRTRLKGGVAVVRDLRSSHDRVAGDLLDRWGLYRRHCQGRRMGQTADETILPRLQANKSLPSRCDIIPTGPVVSVLWGLGGLAGE